MVLPKEMLLYTVDEYLSLDRSSEERYEYLDGHVFAMAGESLEPDTSRLCIGLAASAPA